MHLPVDKEVPGECWFYSCELSSMRIFINCFDWNNFVSVLQGVLVLCAVSLMDSEILRLRPGKGSHHFKKKEVF